MSRVVWTSGASQWSHRRRHTHPFPHSPHSSSIARWHARITQRRQWQWHREAGRLREATTGEIARQKGRRENECSNSRSSSIRKKNTPMKRGNESTFVTSCSSLVSQLVRLLGSSKVSFDLVCCANGRKRLVRLASTFSLVAGCRCRCSLLPAGKERAAHDARVTRITIERDHCSSAARRPPVAHCLSACSFRRPPAAAATISSSRTPHSLA